MNQFSSAKDEYSGASLRELVRDLLKMRWSIVFWSMAVLPVLLLGVMLIPNKYGSSAQILVRLGRGAVSIDPTASVSQQSVSLQDSRLAQVNSVKALIGNDAMVKRVVDRVGVDRILEPHGFLETGLHSLVQWVNGLRPDFGSQLGNAKMTSEEIQQHKKLEEACQLVSNEIGISATKDAYTISLYIKTGDPFLSHDLMTAFVEEYKRHHVEAYQSAGSLDYFEIHADETRQRALATQASLRDAKTQRGIVEVEAAKVNLNASLAQVKDSILKNESEMAAVESKLAAFRKEIADTKPQMESAVILGIPKSAGSGMRVNLYDLEVNYQNLLSRYDENHPKVEAARIQLEAATKIADSEGGDEPQRTVSTNPLYQQLQASINSTQAELAGLMSKRDTLSEQLETLNKELATLHITGFDLTQLQWEASIAESEYLKAANTLQSVQQLSELGRLGLSEISVVQDPTLFLKKISPQRLILFVLGFFTAGAFGLAQAVVRSMLASANTFSRVEGQLHETTVPFREKPASEPRSYPASEYRAQQSIDVTHIEQPEDDGMLKSSESRAVLAR